MAGIVLAECDGSVWLARGGEHFDDLLANLLPGTVTVEFIICASHEEVRAMWREHNDTETEGEEPWVLNPAIVRRIKGRAGSQSIRFTPWSAMLDEAAQDMLGAAAAQLQANAAARLALRQFSPADAPPGLSVLQRLRGQLLAGALARAGADPASLGHETHASDTPGDADRIDLITVIVMAE